MKAVTQEHACGCAVACVAAVLGTTYKKALALFDDPGHAGNRGYYCREIVEALGKAGRRYAYSYVKAGRDAIRLPGTIVFIRKSAGYPSGHFLARTDGAWMDPWINFPRVNPACSGFRRRLPGKAGWVIRPAV